jgi:hypothetical protein
MLETTTYEPVEGIRLHGITCCRHCGQVPEQHHSDGRCYTNDELSARLAFWQRERRFPGPDEGCEPQEVP